MSREIDILAREFHKTSATVLRSDFSLYQRDFIKDGSKFVKEVERTAKKEKSGKVVLIAILYE
jgi:hypothetical protein